jgi:hypothetical protein
MKKLIFLIPMLLIGFIAFAQGTDPVEPIPPDDIIEWASRFPEMIGSFWGVFASVFFLVPFLLGILNLTEAKKAVKYLLLGAVTVIMIVLASVLEMGYLNGAYLWFIVLNGAACIGAQVFGYALFKNALDKAADKFNPWKPAD